MKTCALLVTLAVATSSTGCVAYVAQQKTRDEKIEPGWAALAVAGEVALGSLFGWGLQGANEKHPDDYQIGLPGWLAIGNGVVLAADALTAVVIMAAH